MFPELILVLILLVCYFCVIKNKEHMTGAEVFEKTGGKLDMNYEKFLSKLPEANIVNYYDLKKIYSEGNYTPNNIDKYL